MSRRLAVWRPGQAVRHRGRSAIVATPAYTSAGFLRLEVGLPEVRLVDPRSRDLEPELLLMRAPTQGQGRMPEGRKCDSAGRGPAIESGQPPFLSAAGGPR